VPPLPPVSNVIRVALTGNQGSGVWANHFFCDWTGTGPSIADLDLFCTAISVAWSSHLASHFVHDISLTGVEAVDLTSSTGAVGAWAGVVTGTGTGSIMGAQMCGVISLKIARRYKGGHPRTYLPCLLQSQLLDESHWTPSGIGVVANDYGLFIQASLSGSYTSFHPNNHLNISYYHAGALRPTPVRDDIIGYVGVSKIGTIRRRIAS